MPLNKVTSNNRNSVRTTAGNADFITIATAGDLGQAAVVGNLYIVLRSV